MGRFFRPVLCLALVASIGIGIFIFTDKAKAIPSEAVVVLNEFSVENNWIEIASGDNTGADLSSDTWEIVVTAFTPAPVVNTTTLSGTLPNYGLLVFSPVSSLSAAYDTLIVLYHNGSQKDAVQYGTCSIPGGIPCVATPGAGESGAVLDPAAHTTWSVDATPSKGWFNNAVDYECPLVASTTPPTLSSVADCIMTETGGVTTNLASYDNPTQMGAIVGQELAFEKVGVGKITFNQTVNFTDSDVVNAIASLGDSLNVYNGILQFPSDIDTAMGNLGATLSYYGVDDLGFDLSELPEIVVKDDGGNTISPISITYPVMSDFSTSTGDLTFSVDHFTEFDLEITLTETVPVSDPSSIVAPSYTFYTNVAGTGNISYGGDCSSATADSVVGDNTITFNTLAPGLHDNCTITVSAFGGAIPKTLDVTPFTIVTADTEDVAADMEQLTWDSIKGGNATSSHVTVALTDPLPSTGAYGSTITWSSGSPSHVSDDGQTVTRNPYNGGNVEFSFTATLTKGAYSDTKSFVLVVPQETGIISETTPVPTPTNNTTPSYQYSLTEDANVGVGGVCGPYTTGYAGVAGVNTITFLPMPDGVYSGCLIVADDGVEALGEYMISPFTIDTVAPTSTATAEGGYVFGNWTNDDVTVTFGCTDDSSGCETTYNANQYPYHCVDYSNVCTPDTATHDVLVSGENTFYVRYFSRDSAGNTEDIQSVQIKIDKTGPNPAEVSHVYLSDATEVSSGGNVSGTIKILDTSGDGDSGMNRVEFRYSPSYELIEEVTTVNGDGYYETNLDTTGLSNGTYGIIGRAYDTAGNYTDSAVFTVVVANEEPGYIQSLINAADPGDTVFIPSGTYAECLTIDKSLTLNGDDASNTFLDIAGCGGAGGINISASNVTVSNLTLRSSASFNAYEASNAIYVSDASPITGLTMDTLVITGANTWTGINLNSASGQLRNSDVENSCTGVSLDSSSNFAIDSNTISHNGVRSECNPTTGIAINNSSGITITNNTISDNDVGIHVYTNSPSLAIHNNIITGNDGSVASSGYGVLNDYEGTIDATMNWWGSEAGPSYTDSASSDGDYISDYNVEYSPWYGDSALASLRGEPLGEGGSMYYDLYEDFSSENHGYTLNIPNGTTVTGASTWNGDLNGPTVTTLATANRPTRTGYTTTMGNAIEIGYSDSELTLSQAARLVIPGEAGKKVGYYRPGIAFTEITYVCGDDTQSWADSNLGGESSVSNDCKVDSGEDLVVWTKHFTTFATYEQSQNSSGGGGGGGGSYNLIIPTNLLVVINSGAVSSDSANVTLALSATGATEMAISNTSDFSGANWETYSATKSWTLFSGVGLKTVYAKFRNSYGNASEIVSDTITLNTAEGGVTQPAGTNDTAGTNGTGTTSGQGPTGGDTGGIGGIPESSTSSVVMGGSNATSTLQPGSQLSFSYSYGNVSSSTLYVKIVRELTNSKGTMVKKLTAYRTIKKGAVFKADVKEMLSPKLASGVYTMRVKIYNARTGKLLGNNAFKIVVKKKFYTFSALPTANAIAFNEATFKKMKKSVALPGTVWMRYSYTNLTTAKQSIKMMRELIGPDGKVLSSRFGRWSMVPGEKDSGSFIQYISGKLAVGGYRLRVRALDWKTGELIAENTMSFKVEMK